MEHCNLLLCAGESDIENPPFCFKLLLTTGIAIRPDLILNIQQYDSIEFFALGTQCGHQMNWPLRKVRLSDVVVKGRSINQCVFRSFDVIDKRSKVVFILARKLGQVKERRVGEENILFAFAEIVLETLKALAKRE